MKKTLFVGAAVVVIVALAATAIVLQTRYRESRRQYASTKAAEDSLRTRFDTAVAAIAEIQDSLTTIMPNETDVMNLSRDIEKGARSAKPMNERMLQSISDLKRGIQDSKRLIQRLEKRLKDSDVKTAGLEKIIENLKRVVGARESMIRGLSARVDSLKVRVANLETDVAVGTKRIQEQQQEISDKQREIADRQREISTIHYIIGSRKRLMALGLLEESGGLLGIGKATRLAGRFPPDYFTPLDTDAERTIRVAGKKPVVLSAQSLASYQLVPVTKEWSELRITDPTEFRKVRYLVVQVE
jgi:predicted  nucleic acid-binding Zn-ribbon protein